MVQVRLHGIIFTQLRAIPLTMTEDSIWKDARKAALNPSSGISPHSWWFIQYRGLGSRLGITRKTVPVFLAPSQDGGKVESILRTRKNASAGTSAGKCTKAGMKLVGRRSLSLAPPLWRSFVPQSLIQRCNISSLFFLSPHCMYYFVPCHMTTHL